MNTIYNSKNYEQYLTKFRSNFPDYNKTAQLDELRMTEYARLDANQEVYLDYTGGGLYAQSQLDQHFKLLQEGVWGNPHSQNPTSLAMTQKVEQARAFVLEYFNADPEEYDVIFTANASAALKLVGEAFPFMAGGRFLALADNHNSVNGIREFARAKGANAHYIETTLPDLRVPVAELRAQLADCDVEKPNLFAFPGQSNYSGVKHDLAWIAEAQSQGWTVLLDAAAYLPTNQLDLQVHQPDFVSMSFYKIFGYPTGIGALLARHDALRLLQRPWFAGGTITIVSTKGEGWHYMIDGHPAFEDGTVNYLSIPAVEIGLRYIQSVGMQNITARVNALTGWLIQEMTQLKHSNGTPLVRIHGPNNTDSRGGTIAFNMNDADGIRLDHRRVEKLANDDEISLRTGCFCNPGSGEVAHQLTYEDMEQAFQFEQGLSFDEFYDLVGENSDKHPSTIRVSLGIASNFKDVYTLMTFLESFLDRDAKSVNQIAINKSMMPDTA